MALIVKKYLGLIGQDSNQYSAHSLRSGFATSTAASGADERSIMAMTGHKSTEMVRRYIKEANLFKNNALNKMNIYIKKRYTKKYAKSREIGIPNIKRKRLTRNLWK